MSQLEAQKISQTTKLPETKKNSDIQNKSNSQPSVISNPLRGFNIDQTNKCKLCQEHQQNEIFGSCGHKFCRNCLNTYYLYKISLMERIVCPQENCQVLADTSKALFQALPQESKQKYRKVELWNQTIGNKNIRLCPSQQCEGLINATQNNLECPKCHIIFCIECLLPKHEGPCDENFKKKFKNMKRCPKCRMFIQKNGGCDHMTCRCGHQFCYMCQKDWNSGDGHDDCIDYNIRRVNNLWAQPHLIAEPWVAQWPINKQIRIAYLMVILFPIFMVLGLALWILFVLLATIINFFYGPCLIPREFPVLQRPIFWIFYTLLTIVGALSAFFIGLVKGFTIYLFLVGEYCKVICMLMTGPTDPEEGQRQQS